jgi:hypothetical protein
MVISVQLSSLMGCSQIHWADMNTIAGPDALENSTSHIEVSPGFGYGFCFGTLPL